MRESQKPRVPKPLRIGNVLVDPPLIVAPMAGVTDSAYRFIMAEHGAGMVTSEMVSAQGVVRDQPATCRLFRQDPPVSVPLAVQLFGSDPSVIAEAAARLEAEGASLIDLNAGCPVKKVVRQRAGAGLLREPDRLARIVEALKKAVTIPVTVKIRLGWDSQSINVVNVAERLSSAGADAIALHCRTAAQHYSGQADWSWIRKVKSAVKIPVIGNGDITSPSLAEAMIEQTGCDAVMIGRATLGNPWLLEVIASHWGRLSPRDIKPDWSSYHETVCTHLDLFQRRRPASAGHFKKFLIWYTRGCPEASRLRGALSQRQGLDEMLAAFNVWVQDIAARGHPFLSVKVPEAAGVGDVVSDEVMWNESCCG